MRFDILGPLECWYAGERVRLGGRVQERVLIALLLEAGRVVSVDRLVEAVWDGRPPATAVRQIRKGVAELRRRLPAGPRLVLTDGPGYRTAVAVEQVDLLLFHAHLGSAREELAAGRPARALPLLRAALALWRGPRAAGAGGRVLEAASAALEEHRLRATEQLCALRLELGRDTGDLVGELRELVEAYPLRETLRAQLMRALYLAGRQAEALTEFARVRAYLSEELGVDPSRELVRMHADILRRGTVLPGVTGAFP
ncbi:AfsR/SARP family transcriptional regulator [Streptomyces sp. HU2014]|uniref:AfsR/SARP family transcriptional regulator n=1 Tax=Streptomyces sp. HU2014 TaxID=2939414 RepID=UPI00200C70C0|nr:AfsR/SARP family transcriptional regulator [Streptomyces sp. HU2014]UQI47426.1 AfsR/SARP family transcriptional regulator [Streptomyces sp. HU2014]